jgi:carotenoid cleavage dioxygenase
MPYSVDPRTLATLGTADFGGAIDRLSAHSRPDERTGELLWFDYDVKPPFMRYGVIGPDRVSRHAIDVPIDHPPLPHDMAVTPNWTNPAHLSSAGASTPNAIAAGRYKVNLPPRPAAHPLRAGWPR